jgi:hypothetical protein
MSEFRSKHQILIDIIIERMKKDGFTISGVFDRSPAYQETKVIKKWSPDVSGYNSSRDLKAYGEAKLCDYLYEKQSEKTGEQFVEFSHGMMEKTGVEIPFYLAVPKECEETLKRKLTELGLTQKGNIILILAEL